MLQVSESTRMWEHAKTSAEHGDVVWSPVKSLWYTAHLLIGFIGGALFFSWSALAVFIVLTGTTVCLGHSLGMHRRLIHKSYQCPLWLEQVFVYCGVLVGMAGPMGMVYQHDLRDWAQRKKHCHAFLRHGESFLTDAWYQLHCELKLDDPPVLKIEPRIRDNRVYQFMEATWMQQQLPLALILFVLGGLPWVVWGISARITISLTGHWMVGYFAHNKGELDWHIDDVAVQGYNVPFVGVLTMGESWHNNHHAYPESARLGIKTDQVDPGWWVLSVLIKLRLVWNAKLPDDLVSRGTEVSPQATASHFNYL